MTRPTALGVDGLVKTFGGTRAIDGVSLSVEPGTIHALLGGNGSGKSTTIKVLSGMYRPETGAIDAWGERFDATSWTASNARDVGLRFVHQQHSTFPDLSVAENLAIGHGFETGRGKRVHWRSQRRRARELLARFGLDIDPAADLAMYGVATHAMVAIARALQDVELAGGEDARGILVLDEPTAALPPKEVELLLAELRRFASEGQTIVYVTHRLEEVVQIADRATVLRDGRVAGTLEAAKINHGSLVSMITGSADLPTVSRGTSKQRASVRVQCDGLVGGAIRDASFGVCQGEIVGVAGLLGSGRSTLLRLIAGDAVREEGEIRVDGEPVSYAGPREAGRAGVAYSPEDRRISAAFMELSVRENMGMVSVGRYFRGGRLHHRKETADARGLMQTYQVSAASSEMPLGALSGGNQQKALLVRWLRLEPRLLLLDEPTQGVDVGARAEIWQLVRQAVDAGAAALVILSDFDELVTVCDRTVVVCGGRTVSEHECEQLSVNALERAALGMEGVAA